MVSDHWRSKVLEGPSEQSSVGEELLLLQYGATFMERIERKRGVPGVVMRACHMALIAGVPEQGLEKKKAKTNPRSLCKLPVYVEESW